MDSTGKNLFESSKQRKVELGEGEWIVIEDKGNGVFAIVGENISMGNRLGVSIEDSGDFENLDDPVTQAEFGGMLRVAQHIKIDGVEIDLENKIIHAPSITEIEKVLTKIKLTFFNPEDI